METIVAQKAMQSRNLITDIRSLKARNVLRGLIGKNDPVTLLKSLESIARLGGDADYKIALQVVRNSAIFDKRGVTRDFTKTLPRAVPKTVGLKLDEITEKVFANSDRLAFLVEKCKRIFERIAEGEFYLAVECVRELIDSGGASVFALRTLFFIRNHASEQELVQLVENVLNSMSAENVRYLTLVIRELSSNKTDYFNISEKIAGASDGVLYQIAKTFADHIPRTSEVYLNTLNAYYAVSLLDAALYIFATNRLSLPYAFIGLPQNIAVVCQALTETKFDVFGFYDTEDEFVGLGLYRECFLLIESTPFFEYKTVHGALFNPVENKDAYRVPYERQKIREYFSSVNRLADIGNSATKSEESLRIYWGGRACSFENSSALIYLLERLDGDLAGEEAEFVRLMSITRDIGIICPKYLLNAIKVHAETAELLLVCFCLLHIKEKSQLIEHELRRTLQIIASERFNGDLVRLFDHMFDISSAVATHLLQVCDEMFLSKLFKITANPNQAIELRAAILEWFGKKSGDSAYIERAKNLRIDVQINRQRGTIDDSRIYVDPVKFSQWVTDNVLNEMTILLETAEMRADGSLGNVAWDKVKSGITHAEQLAALVTKCYEVFCSNKIFGIASYLGRRIRHGTFKGTGLNEIKRLAADERYERLFQNSQFSQSFSSWLNEYEEHLDNLRDKFLYVQDKTKPDGMIHTDVRTPAKRVAASHLLMAIVKSFQANRNGVELPYLITEYCWRLIEEDLAGIRKTLMESKARYGVFRTGIELDFFSKQRECREFCQEINSVAAEKFRTISSWFNKPSIASPSADVVLLFKAVVSEIQGMFKGYNPTIRLNEVSVPISGGVYFTIYDALYILIYNAAKYGEQSGILELEVSINNDSGISSIVIAITSEISRFSSMDSVMTSIQSALVGDCEDALVTEGRSGIKKLRRMQQDSYIGSVQYSFDDRRVRASFNFRIDYQL